MACMVEGCNFLLNAGESCMRSSNVFVRVLEQQHE